MDELGRLARDFATKIQRLLNTTICDGPTITAVVHPASPEILVGHRLTKKSLESQRFRVRRGGGRTWCWLNISFRLGLDDERKYLTVISSFIGVYADDDDRACLCHFDYERDKPGGYPEAHLQVFGESNALARWGGRVQDRGLERLHFPVGGRRYRPILEDVIEFLISEKLATGKDRWQQAVADGRREFQRLQLRAAIRRDPETARQMVRELAGSGQ